MFSRCVQSTMRIIKPFVFRLWYVLFKNAFLRYGDSSLIIIDVINRGSFNILIIYKVAICCLEYTHQTNIQPGCAYFIAGVTLSRSTAVMKLFVFWNTCLKASTNCTLHSQDRSLALKYKMGLAYVSLIVSQSYDKKTIQEKTQQPETFVNS